MKLSKYTIETMLPGQTLQIVCEDPAELDSATQLAYKTRREMGLAKSQLGISRSAVTMTLTLRMFSHDPRMS